MSKRMDISSKFLMIWHGRHSRFFKSAPPLQNSKGNPLSGTVKQTGVGKFCKYRHLSRKSVVICSLPKNYYWFKFLPVTEKLSKRQFFEIRCNYRALCSEFSFNASWKTTLRRSIVLTSAPQVNGHGPSFDRVQNRSP